MEDLSLPGHDKLGVQISATNSVSGNKPGGTLGPALFRAQAV
jgi:hypothetical protein